MSLDLTQCPVCRARFTGDEPLDAPCRRCQSDLSLLRLTYQGARDLRDAARREIARGSHQRALELARRSLALVDEPETRRTMAASLAAADHLAAALALLEQS
jgi:hypothetical protein